METWLWSWPWHFSWIIHAHRHLKHRLEDHHSTLLALRSGLPANPAPLDNGGASVPVRNVSAPAYNPPSTPHQVETHSCNEPLLPNKPLPSTPMQEGEEEIVITPPPPPSKEAVRRAIEEVLGGRFDEDEDEEISIEDLHALNNSRKRGWGEDTDRVLEEGEDEDAEDEVEIVEKPHPSKKVRKRGGDDAPASLETSIEPSKSEYPFQSKKGTHPMISLRWCFLSPMFPVKGLVARH